MHAPVTVHAIVKKVNLQKGHNIKYKSKYKSRLLSSPPNVNAQYLSLFLFFCLPSKNFIIAIYFVVVIIYVNLHRDFHFLYINIDGRGMGREEDKRQREVYPFQFTFRQWKFPFVKIFRFRISSFRRINCFIKWLLQSKAICNLILLICTSNTI